MNVSLKKQVKFWPTSKMWSVTFIAIDPEYQNLSACIFNKELKIAEEKALADISSRLNGLIEYNLPSEETAYVLDLQPTPEIIADVETVDKIIEKEGVKKRRNKGKKKDKK